MKEIWHLVLTGGPCSGKTTAIATIEKELSARGYHVLIVPETATELISNGIRPFGNCLDNLSFQKILFEKQSHKEMLYLEVAKKIPANKVVILYDRGLMENKTYVCFVYMNQYFELDLFDFSNDKAIVEIELTSESDVVRFPEFLTIIKEITDDLSYRNIALARNQKL